MKIAMIVRKLNVRGGVQRHALSLAQELARRGHTVTIYAFRYAPEHCYLHLLPGLRIVSLFVPSRMPREAGRYTGGTGFVGAWRFLRDEERQAKHLALLIDPDTELLNPHDGLSERAAYFFKRHVRKVPSVWTIHDLPTRAFGTLRARENGAPRPPFAKRMMHWVLDLRGRMFAAAQDRIAVLNEDDALRVRAAFGREAHVVQNGISIAEFPYMERRPPAPHAVRLLMNGIFFRHRRFEDGIRALYALCARGCDARLTIAGDAGTDSAYRAELAMLVRALGLENRVTFAGALPEEAFKESYRTHDIFLFPNHLQSWGLAVFEAMASGTPVIVSKSAGASAALTDGVHALFVPPKTPTAIADAVAALLRAPERYRALAREGRRFVEERISWAKLADQMCDIFARAAAQS